MGSVSKVTFLALLMATTAGLWVVASPVIGDHRSPCKIESEQSLERFEGRCEDAIDACPAGGPSVGRNILLVAPSAVHPCMFRFTRRHGSFDLGNPRLDDGECRYLDASETAARGFRFDRNVLDPVDLGRCVSGRCERSYCIEEPAIVCREGGQKTVCPHGGRCAPERSCKTHSDCLALSSPTFDRLAKQSILIPDLALRTGSGEEVWTRLSTGRLADDLELDELEACEHVADEAAGAVCGTCPSSLDPNLGDTTCEASCSECENTRTLSRMLYDRLPTSYFTFVVGDIHNKRNGVYGLRRCRAFQRQKEGRLGALDASDCGYSKQPDTCHERVREDLRDGVVNEPPLRARRRLGDFRRFLHRLPVDENRHLLAPFAILWSTDLAERTREQDAAPIFRRHYFVCDRDKNDEARCDPNDPTNPDPGYCFRPTHYDECQSPIGGRSVKIADALSRFSALDYQVGTLLDELNRTCVCDAGDAKSLLDLTTVVVATQSPILASKNALYEDAASIAVPPHAKNRGLLIISEPEHRLVKTHKNFRRFEKVSGQSAEDIDIFPTVLEVATKPRDGEIRRSHSFDLPEDLRGRSLWPWIDTKVVPCQSDRQCGALGYCLGGWCRRISVRDVTIEKSKMARRTAGTRAESTDDDSSTQTLWTALPKPGAVGVCVGATPLGFPAFRERFCLVDEECPEGSDCRRAVDSDRGARLCMNWRETTRFRVCNSDSVCGFDVCNAGRADGTCEAGRCDGPPIGFTDTADQCCLRDIFDRSCSPRGTCSLVRLAYSIVGKSGAGGKSVLDSSSYVAHELSSDPDRRASDLFELDEASGRDMLGCCLRCMLDQCIAEWANWDEADAARDPTYGCLNGEDLALTHPCHCACSTGECDPAACG